MLVAEELAGVSKRASLLSPPLLYALADVDTWGDATVDCVRVCAEEGVGWIQLRAKRLEDDALFRLAEASLEAIAKTDSKLWIDDRVDLASLLPFAGVHLGQADLSPESARGILGSSPWIGFSTHDLSQAAQAQENQSVDVVAFGPVFQTGSKRNPEPTVGLDRLRAVRDLVSKPLVAIGGLDEERAQEAIDAGADSVAVIGALATDGLSGLARRCRAFHSCLRR